MRVPGTVAPRPLLGPWAVTSRLDKQRLLWLRSPACPLPASHPEPRLTSLRPARRAEARW